MQDQQNAARRRTIVRAVIDLSEQRDLPVPMDIGLKQESVTLRLDNNDPFGVRSWADALGITDVTIDRLNEGRPDAFDSVRAEAWYHTGPVWLDLRHVYVWSACDVDEGGEH